MELKNIRTTSPKGAKDRVLVKFSAFNSRHVSLKKERHFDLIMAFCEYYVDFKLKKLTSAYSFPPFGEVVLLSLKSTCGGNEVAMDKFLAIFQEILDHMPRNPGPSAENANQSSAICQDCQGQSAENANKSSAICRDCQELPLKHACQECRVCLQKLNLPRPAKALPMNLL